MTADTVSIATTPTPSSEPTTIQHWFRECQRAQVAAAQKADDLDDSTGYNRWREALFLLGNCEPDNIDDIILRATAALDGTFLDEPDDGWGGHARLYLAARLLIDLHRLKAAPEAFLPGIVAAAERDSKSEQSQSGNHAKVAKLVKRQAPAAEAAQ